MHLVCARLDSKIRHAGLSTAILGAHRAALELELADGFGAGTELVVAAALEVHSAQGNALDQNFVRVILAAIDGAFKFVAGGARKASEDKRLDLAVAVGHRYRPAL